MCQNYVGYYRVSTEKQGRIRLGLEAQQTAVEAFIVSRGSDAKLVAVFTEVESGKRSGRTILAALLVLAVLAPTFAEAKHRGETCWRTNRHTGQHFRIC